ncbi:MAG: TetR/AcrR family transcriptional regulator [Pseudonocardiaceae bacterium]
MLDAAVEVFSRSGFHPASMDEIADVAGVSKPMIYAYLGSKDDLFGLCIHREAQYLVERITAAVPDGPAPDERLYRGLLAFFEFVAEHRDGWIVLYRQARVQGGAFAAQTTVVRERIVGVVAGLLAGTADEAARARATPTAHALVGAAEALSDWGVEHPEQTPQELARRLMDFAWTGLGGLVRGERWTGPSS